MAKPRKRVTHEKLVEIIGLLAALAHRGRFVAPSSMDAPDRPAVVVVEGPDAKQFEVSTHALDGAVRRGWIGDDGTQGRLVLTPEGRTALRRARSQLVTANAQASAGPAPPAARQPTENPAESPLSWLRGRRDADGRQMLTATQIAAGERLRMELTIAGMTPRVTMAWSGTPISGDRGAAAAGFSRDLADNVIAARSRVTAALRAVGPELGDILIDVCGHLRGLEEIARTERWPRRSAKLILQRALSALARHYGLEPQITAEETIARRLRHWGADDYRPTLHSRPGDDQAA